MEIEYQEALRAATEMAKNVNRQEFEKNKELLKKIQKRVHKEKGLRKDIEREKQKLKMQLKELEQEHLMSFERETKCSDNLISMVSFEDTVPVQIKAHVDQIEILYNVFDSVSIDPHTPTLSLNEALFHSFLAEPEMNEHDAREKSKAAMSIITNRRRRQMLAVGGEELSATKRHKNNGTYLTYHSLCMELLQQKQLSVVPYALVRMSANVLATSPTFILALNCRLRKIAQGHVNTILLGCVLGIRDSVEFELYLSQVQEHNSRSMPCMQEVMVKGQNRMRTCGIRVNFGKEKCSYHLRRKS